MGGEIEGIGVTPDEVLAAGSADVAYRFAIGDASCTPLREIERGWASVAVACSGTRAVLGSRRSTLGHGGQVVFLEMPGGAELPSPEGARAHDDWVQSLSTTPDGRWVLSGGGTELKLWDPRDGKLRLTCKAHANLRVAALLPDAERAIAGGVDGWLGIYELATGRILTRLERHTHELSAVTVRPDGKRAVTAAEDQKIVLWDLETGAPLDQIDLSSAADWATSLALSPDGKTVVAGTARGVVIGFRFVGR
jgi:WD40 repeat protein